jgi:O-succinylbenzoate synthase
MSITRAYEEVVEFIAAGVSSDDVATFRPSEAARQRVTELVEREKSSGLNAEERSELENYLHLEHIMRLAKARARRHLSPK